MAEPNTFGVIDSYEFYESAVQLSCSGQHLGVAIRPIL